jgi:GNAT superfamily N-acetyltransferase
MRTTDRDYSEVSGDFNRLCHFVIRQDDHLRRYSTWSLGRLVDWRYGLYEDKRAVAAFCDRNAHLWFDAFGDLAALAISESGDAGFALLTARGYRFLHEEILAWVLETWGDRGPGLYIEITEHQDLEAAVLERFGFEREGRFYARRFDLNGELPERRPLEKGFTIIDMATHPDYRRQRILRDNAFSGKNNLTEAELRHNLEFYNYSHEGPIYHPQTDLCVKAEDGRFVAGCEALIDARNAGADIERVCTHSDFRRRGFARAVIVECLHRLQGMGLENTYIAGYGPGAIALYGSLGHAGEMEFCVYKMPAT